MGAPRLTEAISLEDRIADLVDTAVTAAVERAEVRAEERHRAQRTHLSVAEAAAAIGIGRTLCHRLVNEGTIPSVRLGDRIVIPVHALQQLGTS